MKVNVIVSRGLFDKAMMQQTSFNQSEIGLRVLHKIKNKSLF